MRNIEVQYFDPELSEENKAYMDTLDRDRLVLWSQRLRIGIDTMKREGKPDDYCVLVRAKHMRAYVQKRLEGIDIPADKRVREETSSNSRKPSNKGLLDFIVSSGTVNNDFEQRGRIHGA